MLGQVGAYDARMIYFQKVYGLCHWKWWPTGGFGWSGFEETIYLGKIKKYFFWFIKFTGGEGGESRHTFSYFKNMRKQTKQVKIVFQTSIVRRIEGGVEA